MKVKDFVVAFLTEQNINGMAVNLIGNLGKTLRLAQTRYPEYNNLFYDKRLWTGKRDITSCMSYPVTKLEGLYVTANTDKTANEQLVQIFKTKLLQLKKNWQNFQKNDQNACYLPGSMHCLSDQRSLWRQEMNYI